MFPDLSRQAGLPGSVRIFVCGTWLISVLCLLWHLKRS
jgi:hypothetical protein